MRKGRFAGLVRGAETGAEADPRPAGFVALLEQSGQGWFWETDALGAIAYVSPALAAALGRREADLIGGTFAELLLVEQAEGDAGDRPTLGFHLSARTPFADVAVRPNGDASRGWLLTGAPQFDEIGRFLGFRGFGTPLTEARGKELAAARLARFDSLTGLPNRAHIEAMLDEALANSERRKQSCALFLIDLDRFKQVNDTLGHPVGDVLLQQVAERMTALLDGDGQPGRLGGDEFAAVFPGVGEEGRLAGIAERLIRALSEPYLIHGHRVSIGASVGIAISRPGRTYRKALVKEADLALYAAKRAGRGTFRFFEPEMDAEEADRKVLESDLRAAIAKNQLWLAYQPIVSVATETLVGFEALVRWSHPTRGPLGPDAFLPIAEASGQMPAIGEWIVRTACREAAGWPDHLRLAVNLCSKELTTGLPPLVAGALAASQLAAGRLELELTETALLDQAGPARDALQALYGLGVRLVLDDFGRGAASLASLKTVPLDRIKLHPSFLRTALPADGRARALAAAVMRLAEALDLAVTAEGAETLADLELVRALGCDDVQGNLFSRPLDAAEASARAADSKPVDPQEAAHSRPPRHSLIRTGRLSAGAGTWSVRLRNISSGGAMVESARAVTPGQVVALDLTEGLVLDADVRWAAGGRVGLRFVEAFDLARLGKARQEAAAQKAALPDYLKATPKASPALSIRDVRRSI